MVSRLRGRPEWRFFGVLPRADRGLAAAWWGLLVARGALPAVFAVAMGWLVGAVQHRGPLAGPLVLMGVTFVLLQVLTPVHQAVSANLGNRVSAYLNDALATACVGPPGIGHLEDPALSEDLTVAREFDRGQTGPPMYLNVDFVAGSLVELVGGIASAIVLFGFNWWAPLVLVAGWVATHWLLRESGVWKDRNTSEVRSAQRHATYAYELAVEPGAAKELRLFGLADWTVERFTERRRRLFELQYAATRLRERPMIWSLLIIVVANGVVFWALGAAAIGGSLPLDRLVVFAQVAIGVGMIAFGGLNWALDGAAAPVAAVQRLEPAMAPAGALTPARTSKPGSGSAGRGRGAVEIELRGLRFGYPQAGRQVFDGLDLTIPAGSSLAVVGQNGAGKTTLAKLLCRLYDPGAGTIRIDGTDLRDLDVEAWRTRVAAVFQDFLKLELPLRDNVAPAGAPEADIRAALADAGASDLADLDTRLATGYGDGTDLSGGQWQRVALARALCAVRQGAGLVLLDEPTAQLDVRGEAAIFDRILTATRDVTTILISHRFSTVRHADRICVLEHGRVVELGSHDELVALGGRYRTMFDLQAQRFTAEVDEEGLSYDTL
ncbi:ABC-type multidrug transport system fused ATPase/permease subunit [Kribbella aluminosa]|uniref:ABC-type multidrug transport system fused ATPase/permease subunit n=1 Tax=Kribbella aluminosa TaxID=416017 RepID=A0ABS4UQQ9_9ACTN|nr:ABC transporter ATP-binding protein [Kribbella aluminosa]MBP2353977.1 ABC-type multidrug transport system fused ATPase/permease subunit [Kribbella aluminosa]